MKYLGLLLGITFLGNTAVFGQSQNELWEKGIIKIYDAKFVPGIISIFHPGVQVLEEGEPVPTTKRKVPKDAYALHGNLVKVREFYRERFNRNSWDNAGGEIKASVNVNRFAWPDIFGQKQNAAWIYPRFSFGAGKSLSLSGSLDNFAEALDVVAHEYTHAVIDRSSNLEYLGQPGALNEHLADVFGVIINQHYNNPKNPYLIGSTVLKGKYKKKSEALRNLLEPNKGLSPQPRHMKELKEIEKYRLYSYELCKEKEDPKQIKCCKPSAENDYCGVHVMSGIPNRAAALILSKMNWDDAGMMFYKVMTKRLNFKSTFKDYAQALLSECEAYPGTCSIVEEALKEVGIIKD